MTRVFSEKDFLAANLDSLSFYNLLPTDHVVIKTDSVKEPANMLAERLIDASTADLLINDLDDLAIALINGCSSFCDFSDWQALADKMAIQYSELISNEKARELRMRLARINYFVRALLDKNNNLLLINKKHY